MIELTNYNLIYVFEEYADVANTGKMSNCIFYCFQ